MKVYCEKNKGNESLLSRINDWVKQTEKSYCSIASPFLNESELNTVRQFCGNKIPYSIDGGHPYAIRAKVIFEASEPWVSDIVCLVAKRKRNETLLEHRDVLGALMNLNIERNQLGDCWVEEDKVVVYTSKHLSNLIQQECIQIAREKVEFQISDIHYSNQIKKEKATGFISSERIDSLVSCIAKKSRTDAQWLIQNQKVMVNHQIVLKSTKRCQSEDIISIRGVGRFIYKGIVKQSRKNKFLIEYEKYVG